MTNYYSTYEQTDGLRTYLTKVFTNMALALGVTTIVAVLCFMSLINGGIVYSLLSNSVFALLLFVIQIVLVMSMSKSVMSGTPTQTRLLMLGYSALTGLTFSVLPMAYGLYNVFVAFIFAAVLFISMACIGHFTSVDISKFSGLLTGGLIALVIMSVLSMFIPVLRNSLLMGYLGLALFLGITAWDMQRIKQMYYQIGEGTIRDNLSIYGAFQLYLDFINIFLYVLRILGSRSSRD